MVPAAVVDAVVADLAPRLQPGDILVDGGNSYYIDDIRRARDLEAHGIQYIEVGTSGGVRGLERGYCLMIGGTSRGYRQARSGFQDARAGTWLGGADASHARRRHRAGRYLHCGPAGAGHFVKMVHNGIEYGLMAAYAEGLNILKHADAGTRARRVDAETAPLRSPEHYQYEFNLADIAELWRRGSVVASWLLDLTAAALAGEPELETFSRVSDSGEGRWTILAAIESSAPAPVLTTALYQRYASRGERQFADRLLSAMRLQFGGHVETART
jgi:6-phosphogluconate dehydrogenase